ncbi:RHS repeat domain-containing protein, partial [Zunongwangia profunda]
NGSSFTEQASNYNLTGMVYDLNGNIRKLKRYGPISMNSQGGVANYGLMDNLTYSYDAGNSSNRLMQVSDAGNKDYGFKDGATSSTEFGYDVNGNLTSDANKGITNITYNHLNLPELITIEGQTIDYAYDATGVKLKKTFGSTNTEYAGNFIYKDGILEFFSTPEGYVSYDNGQFNYVYNYVDHLGNVRLSYTNTGSASSPNLQIIEENNYYPFGLKHEGYNTGISSLGSDIAKKFKYNGIEFEESAGLDLYEMDVRSYDPAIGRFTSLDPVTHFSQSTYTAFDNNPVFWSDPSGADSIYNWETGQYVINGDVVSQDEALAYAQNGGNADGSNNNTPNDSQSTQPKYQFFGVSPTGEQMNLNFGRKNFNILTGYGSDPDDLRKAKLSAFLGLFKTLSQKDQVSVLRFLKIPSKYWVKILGKVGKVGPGSILPAYNIYDEGFAAAPFGIGTLFQPLNDDFHSGARQIANDLMWEDVLTGFNEMMNTETLNDVIIIYSNENLFRQKTINTSAAENLTSRHATGNYKYAYYGTQYGNNLHIFGMYLINND